MKKKTASVTKHPAKAQTKRAKKQKKIRAHLTRKSLNQKQSSSLPTLSNEQFKTLSEKMLDSMSASMKASITRRDFIKAGAAVAGAATLPGLLAACGSGSGNGDNSGKKATETRSFVFDFSWADTDSHDVVLVTGSDYHTLERSTPEKLIQLRETHPVLNRLPDDKMTHHIKLEMPSDGVQWCHVKRFVQGANDGRWDQLMMFIHHPISALMAAAEKEKDLLGAGEFPKVSNKWSKYGLTGQDIVQHIPVALGGSVAAGDPVGLDAFKDSCDTACTMISGHPEMLSLDANSSAYIQNTITSQNSGQLGQFIAFQGPAEPQSTWVDCSSEFQANATGYATLVPVCNPDTGEQATNTNGDLQYIPEYSDTTNSSLNSDGIMPSLESAKQDTTLGANITSTPEGTAGLIWRTQDGVTTSTQSETSLGANSGFSYSTKDFSPGHGYSVNVTSVDDNPSESTLEAVVTMEVKNWYVRYLGLFIRYLDSDGNTISPTQVASDLGDTAMATYYAFNGTGPGPFSTSTDMFLVVLFPEFELFGIPTSETKKTLTIPMPKSATSFLVLSSGLGATSQNTNPYSSSVALGATMTGVVSYGLTFFFLALAAAAGYAPFTKSLESPGTFRTLLPVIINVFELVFINPALNDPAAFKGTAGAVGNLIVSKGAQAILTLMTPEIVEAENEQAVLDAIPFVGVAYAALTAIGTLAQLAETATEVLISPSTYAFEVTLTHDIDVTVRPNLSSDPNGWPATATHFDVTALFDGGTPTTISTPLSLTTNTDPVTIKFSGVPLGGKVAMSVGVYSDNDFLVGNANSATVDNQENVTFDITFKELLIPLVASTVYSHKEVIELDASGNHIWVASTTPPTQEPKGCSPSNGQLCALNGITINTTAAGIGQSFQSYNDAVPTCTNASSHSNAFQFSNISSTQDPQSEFIFSGCTFSGSPRLVYDLMNRPDNNFYLDTDSSGPNYQSVIRQVRLDKNNNPGFDGPDSDLAWGKLQHPSDALLLHPAGKIISIANSKDKFEVIDLPDAAMSDADAPFSHTYSAKGLRPGLLDGPVLAALNPSGAILVIEAVNKRNQAFDINGNAAPVFPPTSEYPNGAYFVPLKEQTVKQYLDFAIEFKGYMFLLLIVDNGGSDVFTLDIYKPDGSYLATTTGFEAQRLAINYWRDIYTQNSQVLKLPGGALPARTEPSISHWIPSTP